MHDIVQDYYGRQLQSSSDLKTSACCDISQMPAWLKPLPGRIHPDVLSRYYGCGLVCPPLLEGCRVLDLGCGSGRDVYALAQLVGPVVAALLIAAQLLDARMSILLMAAVMALGGLLFARRVAETMSRRVTRMDHTQGAGAHALDWGIAWLALKIF